MHLTEKHFIDAVIFNEPILYIMLLDLFLLYKVKRNSIISWEKTRERSLQKFECIVNKKWLCGINERQTTK